MSRNQGVAGFGGLEDDLLIEQRPVKFTAELAGNGALTERAIAVKLRKLQRPRRASMVANKKVRNFACGLASPGICIRI